MIKYFFKRVAFAIVALILLLILVFFLMQAIPGFPIIRSNTDTDADYLLKLENAGLLDSPFVQFGRFISGIFTDGRFGVVYSGSKSVIDTVLEPMQYTIMIAGPAFVISAFIGIGFGILSAYYRGKAPDIIINVMAVLFISSPSFILALYLLKISSFLGLPPAFVIPTGDNIQETMLSMVLPITSMVLSSISIIIYYTRNELVDVFQQEYIKTALAKGLKFRAVVFKHALRNGMIPIISVLLPSFMVILSGSIIIERFFGIPGTSSILISSIQNKEIYLVLFITVFFSAIYFALQIFIDVLYTIIDPRITLANKNSIGVTYYIKSYFARLKIRKQVKNSINMISSTKVKLNLNKNIEVLNTDEETNLVDISFMSNYKENYLSSIKYQENSESRNNELEIPNLVAKDFKNVDIFKNDNSDQITGKPTKYIADIGRRFFKSKPATFFVGLLSMIIIMTIIFPLLNWNAVNISVGGLPSSLISNLPPRIPWLGITGISNIVLDNDTYLSLLQYDLTYNIWESAEFINGSWYITGYNPYNIPSLNNLVLIAGTDGQSRDWWSLLWYSTAQSLTLSLVAATGAVLIGTVYGSISGTFAGRTTDTIMMRIVEILLGVPLIVWVMIFSLVISDGTLNLFTIAFALILTGWMSSAITARTFIIKYKDSEFIQAAKTIGASQSRIIFTHLIPNILGRLIVRFVNMIPAVIFFEASLVFLGLRGTDEMSLGVMIQNAFDTQYLHLLLFPTIMILLITLSSQIIANNLNDSLDPKIIG